MKQRYSYFERLLGLPGKMAAKEMNRYDKGKTRCDNCKVNIDFTAMPELSFAKCPQCGDLVFVPMDLKQWWLVSPIGAGGFGAVYLGRSKDDPSQNVAVKLLQRTKDLMPGAEEDFIREIDIAYSLGDHPNMVPVFACGESENKRFLVMDFIDGMRFSDYVREQGNKLPPEECLYYALDTIDALEFVLKSGYVYRDVKPGNMIVRRRDNSIILVDLGSCLNTNDARNSGDLPVVGSPLCMAPERYLREGEDFRSDIYSLGMVIYFALKGEYYHAPTEIQRIMRGHTRKLRVPLKSKMLEFDPEIAQLVDFMIKRNRDERPRSYDDLRQAIYWVLAKLQKTKIKNSVVHARRDRFLNTYGKLKRE